MRHVKSERLKKLEGELLDLEQWLKLGLVPNKDIPKHEEEIQSLREKITEEKERLRFLRESGEVEELATAKRGPSKSSYADMPTIPDIDMAETQTGVTDRYEGSDETETASDTESGEDDKKGTTQTDDDYPDEESYFSDKNRWKRGGILDPDADEW